jgi:hypothetical protein
MAANRKEGMPGAVARIWGRGGVFGCKPTRPALAIHVQDHKLTLLPQSTKV